MLGVSFGPERGVDSFILTSLLFLAGCTTTDYSLYTGVEDQPISALPVWPGGGEVPRYRFAGLYYGEQNLRVREDDEVKGGLQKALAWLAGVSRDTSLKQMQSPQSGAVDSAGIVYVTDVMTGSIFVFDPGLPEVTSRVDVWRDASRTRTFHAPIAVALDQEERLLVTDAEHGEVFRLDRAGNPVDSFGAGILLRPTGIVRDGDNGEVYVADTHAHDVKVFDENGSHVRTIGRRGTTDGTFNFPIHLTLKHGRLYVVDSMNARVQVFDREGRHQQSIGSRGKFMGQFSRPKGVAVDSEGNIYVVDSYFDYLLVFDPEGEFLLPIGGTGEEVGSFYLPAGVWIDDTDTIYVADTANGRVVTFQFLGGD